MRLAVSRGQRGELIEDGADRRADAAQIAAAAVRHVAIPRREYVDALHPGRDEPEVTGGQLEGCALRCHCASRKLSGSPLHADAVRPEPASVTAGTIFDRTHTPLTVWFAACWNFASGKDGISALSLKRTLEIGAYQTAWAMLHRLRSVLVRPDRELLRGKVEVDETYIGGLDPGLPGGRAQGKKVLTCVAVEILEPKGFGRCRMAPVADASAQSLLAFVSTNVEPGATEITDAWQSYRGLEKKGYIHDRRSQRAASARGEDPGALLPGVHRIASPAKRWLLGTHQGAVDAAHCPAISRGNMYYLPRAASEAVTFG